MRTVLRGVLTAEGVHRVRTLIAGKEFTKGQATSSLQGKNNLQLSPDSPSSFAAGELVSGALRDHEMFQLATMPGYVHPPLFSKYDTGMEYPRHVDSAIMNGHRSDVSVTVFLSNEDEYAGGDLVIDTGDREHAYRLPAGDAIVYPSTTLHRVTRVSSGTRLVSVLWVQSMIRDAAKREILSDLAVAMGSVEEGAHSDRLRHSYWNLVRLWAEV